MLCWLQSYSRQIEQKRNFDVFGSVFSFIWSDDYIDVFMFLFILLLSLKYLDIIVILCYLATLIPTIDLNVPMEEHSPTAPLPVPFPQLVYNPSPPFQHLHVTLHRPDRIHVAKELPETSSPSDLHRTVFD